MDKYLKVPKILEIFIVIDLVKKEKQINIRQEDEGMVKVLLNSRLLPT
jgi:hypothetical protein